MGKQQTILTAKKKLFTYITVLLDRSGSMYKIKDDTEGGFNNFLNEQKQVDGEANISLYQFDNVFETVYENINIQLAKELVLEPRSSTALIDSIVESIEKTEKKIKGLKDKPDNVLFVIITDGEENDSEKYTRKEAFKKISNKRKAGWEFLFIGANQDAIQEAHAYGISAGSSLTYGANQQGVRSTYQTLSSKTSGLRITGSLAMFTAEERENAMGDDS